MKQARTSVLVLAALVLAAASPTAAQRLAYVGVYPDEIATTCTHEGLETLSSAYVIVTNAIPLREITFRAPVPGCLGGPATFVFDESPFATTGDSQNGITIDLGGCTTSPVTVLTIHYVGTNPTGGECCYWPVLAIDGQEFDDFDFVDCNGVTRPAASAVISPVYQCCETFDVLAPYEPFPADGATGVSTDVTLTWLLPDQRCYESIYFSDTPPTPGYPPMDDVDYFTSYDPPEALAPNTTYYWQVRLQCDYDVGSWSDVWMFTTGAGAVPVETSTWGRVKALYEH